MLGLESPGLDRHIVGPTFRTSKRLLGPRKGLFDGASVVGVVGRGVQRPCLKKLVDGLTGLGVEASPVAVLDGGSGLLSSGKPCWFSPWSLGRGADGFALSHCRFI